MNEAHLTDASHQLTRLILLYLHVILRTVTHIYDHDDVLAAEMRALCSRCAFHNTRISLIFSCHLSGLLFQFIKKITL